MSDLRSKAAMHLNLAQKTMGLIHRPSSKGKKTSQESDRFIVCNRCHLPIGSTSELTTHDCFIHHCSLCPPGVKFKNSFLLDRHIAKFHNTNMNSKDPKLVQNGDVHVPTSTEKSRQKSSTDQNQKVVKKQKLNCANCNVVFTTRKDRRHCITCSKTAARKPSDNATTNVFKKPMVPNSKALSKSATNSKTSTKSSTNTNRTKSSNAIQNGVKPKPRRIIKEHLSDNGMRSYKVAYSKKICFHCPKCCYGSITKFMFDKHLETLCAKRIKNMTNCIVPIKRIAHTAVAIKREMIDSEYPDPPLPVVKPSPAPATVTSIPNDKDDRTIFCKECMESFSTLQSFNFHVEGKHAMMMTQVDLANLCTLCNRIFRTNAALLLHVCVGKRSNKVNDAPPPQFQERHNALAESILRSKPSHHPNYFHFCTKRLIGVPCVECSHLNFNHSQPMIGPLPESPYDSTADPLSEKTMDYALDNPSEVKDDADEKHDSEEKIGESNLKIIEVCSLTDSKDILGDDKSSFAISDEVPTETDFNMEREKCSPQFVCISESCYQTIDADQRLQHFEDCHGFKIGEEDFNFHFIPLQE